MIAHYWIAQHINDLFRNEPRNVGVFVRVGNQTAAKFFGEVGGLIDGRKLKNFPYPEVYRQWIQYWRNQLLKNNPELLVNTSGPNYRVVEAGQITDAETDTPEDVANYLYALLVSEGGFREAMGIEEAVIERGVAPLEIDLANALQEKNLLANEGDLIVGHPVRRGVTIFGRQIRHKPAFFQENTKRYVMEAVDFTVSQKRRARDHAAWSAYMFRDIGDPNTEAIAIVRAGEEDREIEDVKNGLVVLRNEATMVNWLRSDEREQFLEARQAIAMAR